MSNFNPQPDSPNKDNTGNQTYYDVSEKEYEDNLAKTRKFCRNVEKNLNNYIKNETFYDPSKPSSTYFLSIESISGIKKEQKAVNTNLQSLQNKTTGLKCNKHI